MVAADHLGHLPLWEAAIEADSAEVFAQGTGVFRVAGPRLASSEGDAAAWQLMNEPLGLRACFLIESSRQGFPPRLPANPRTVGEHLKKALLDRGIRQKEGARSIGCCPGSLGTWEKGRVAPEVRFWPAILAFLGYGPPPGARGFGGRLKRAVAQIFPHRV
jgi:hypothetical protein